MTGLHYLTLTETARRLQHRDLTASELTEAYLTRIASLDATVYAYITVTADRAEQDAERATREMGGGEYRGPLHGIPMALKDLVDTAGIRTTAHSRVYADRVPAEDASVATRLREAGSVLLGKLAMHELATGGPDADGPFPAARNPWDLDRMPGGSSSGSAAALAAGLCAGALGSDTGGSIRGPASWCGIVGHKPTYGLVSRRGVVPLSWTLDHVGPMARTVEDAALILQVIAGHDPADDTSAEVAIPDYRRALDGAVRGLRVGVPWSFLESTANDLSPETDRCFRTAIEDFGSLGVSVLPIEIPFAEYAEGISTGILTSEAFAYHEENLRTRMNEYGKPFLARVLPGGLRTAADYIQAMRARARYVGEVRELMRSIDVIAMPTSPQPAEPFSEASRYGSRVSYTRFANASGQPSISVPCGFTSDGLPVGLMLTGRLFEDATVLKLAHAYEQAHDWKDRHPSLG